MAEVTVKRCDVFGTVKNVKSYVIGVQVAGDWSCGPPDSPMVARNEVDLSPRGLKRVCRAIERALTPTGAGRPEQSGGENSD